MLVITCSLEERKERCSKDICCNECARQNCPFRCKKKVEQDCFDYEEAVK